MSSSPDGTVARWPARLFAIITLIALVFAFVGLPSSSFAIDELYTLHLIRHDRGYSEVFRRALTDTWPPLYYFLLYGWSRLAGLSEAALHLPSAVFAVVAIVCFAYGARRITSRGGMAFACAIGAVSPFWFQQSQNTRGYALGMALSAAMLACALAVFRSYRHGNKVSLSSLTWLMLVGLAASFTHAYLLLAFGMVLLYLLLTIPRAPARLLIVAGGTAVLLLNIGYYWMMLHATEQDVHHMWFKKNFHFFFSQTHDALHALLPVDISVIVLALLLSWAIHSVARTSRGPMACEDIDEARWASRLAWVVLIGVLSCGVAVSFLVAPSFSDRNLLINVPFAWLLLARLYDHAGPRANSRVSRILAAFIVVLIGAHLIILKGRPLPRTEPWRESADFIRQQYPQCMDQPLPVLLPFKFGPPTATFRLLAERDFYGFYLPEATQIQAYLEPEMAGRHSNAEIATAFEQHAATTANNCPLLAWAVHIDEHGAMEIAEDLARRPELAGHRVMIQEINSYAQRLLSWRARPAAFVFTLEGIAPPAIPSAAPKIPSAKMPENVLGDRLVLNHLSSYHGVDGPAYTLDVYSVQRWTRTEDASEDFLVNQRLTCDPPTDLLKELWPDPTLPGCTKRLLPSTSLHRDAPG